MKYVIVGNGIAGTTAALNIRKLDNASEIIIISEEAYPFYSRIRLIDYLAGETDERGLIIFKDEWYEKNRILPILNTKVVDISPDSKEIALSDSQKIKYDRLLIATGGNSFVPPIAGSDKNGVFTLRNIADAKKIKEYSKDKDSIIILGGGVLGIEAGNALRKTGKAVSIVEFFPRLLPRQMDKDGSEILKKTLENMGLRFYLDARAKEIVGENDVRGLLLEDGRLVEGGMIVISAGIRPNTLLLENIGIKPGKGIPVNDRMETAINDIYAAGDLVEHRGVFYGIWPAAEKQGEVAGINMAGGNALYEGTLPSNILKVAGVELLSAGDIDAEGKLESIVSKDADKGIYKKIVIKDNCVVGCILCGNMEGRKEILAAIKESRNIEEMTDILDELKFIQA
ncbi:MAG: FAD-dependent oxidoreductase [Nitrospiraceae bacterium]|nr:FAD-dependent oxidoreductase [Nitrospiraceae bacterium]